VPDAVAVTLAGDRGAAAANSKPALAADAPSWSELTDDRREVLSPVELLAVTLKALADGVLDVGRQGGRRAAMTLQEDDSRSGLLSHALPDLDDRSALGNSCRWPVVAPLELRW
jgi:hypothetical protein